MALGQALQRETLLMLKKMKLNFPRRDLLAGIKSGIVDPTKVVQTALQNAASVAGLLITNEAMIAEKPEKGGEMPLMSSGDGY